MTDSEYIDILDGAARALSREIGVMSESGAKSAENLTAMAKAGRALVDVVSEAFFVLGDHERR
jgi:hypothetical protein